MYFPLKKGDEVMIVFASRCIDAWWYNGGTDTNGNPVTRAPMENRMHDFSDGFVIPGVKSLPRAQSISNVPYADSSTYDQVELRTDDGNAMIAINVQSHNIVINTSSNVNINSTGNTNITAPTVAITGNLTVSGSIVANGNVTGQGTSLHTHTHTSAATGSQTSTPN